MFNRAVVSVAYGTGFDAFTTQRVARANRRLCYESPTQDIRNAIGMHSRGLLNALLLAVAAIAAVLVYSHRPNDELAQPDHALVPIAPRDIRAIDLERVKSPAIRLQRVDDEWHMTLPIKARLDETALARVLDLSRLRAANRLPAQGLDRYGLDQP